MSQPRSLPPRPDLRHLRDEAKRRRRAGEFPSLSAAHLGIAREYGFASWPRLKFAVEAMTQSVTERADALIASATSSDLRRAQALLAADPALARHSLACACACGEVEEVRRRLRDRAAAATEPTGPNGWEPLLYACFSRLLRGMPDRAEGIRRVVATLLEAGADPNAAYIHNGDWLQVALYGAAGINGDPEMTRLLLEAGADPTDEREGLHGNEVLYHACEFADPTCAQMVIDAGARQDLVDYDLARALDFPNHAMVAMFCKHGARPGARHLHRAVWDRRPPETIAVLLDAGAPVDGPDAGGLTALQIAVRWGSTEVATLLTARGADPNVVADGDRALGAYLSGASSVAPEGINPAILDEMVMFSIRHGDLLAMERLLDAGARVDGNPESDEIPLGHACWRGRVEAARALVARGAALAFRDGGSAVGATLHGSRHCHDPQGGPTMQLREEIPTEPYAKLIRFLLAAGAPVPDRVDGARASALIAELGVELDG